MIRYVEGNLFDSRADCLVNAVNCEGVMGKGIAYQFKKKFPRNTRDYAEKCRTGALRIGTIHTYQDGQTWLVNFPTKDRWREPSQLSYIDIGLDRLVEFLNRTDIKRVALPALGCGNGGLPWAEVRNLIDAKLSRVATRCEILVYAPASGKRSLDPAFDFRELVLLKMKQGLKTFDVGHMQRGLFLLNRAAQMRLFRFDTWQNGPYSSDAMRHMMRIRRYQDAFGQSDPQMVYESVYRSIVTRSLEKKMQDLIPLVEAVTRYINDRRITDKRLEGMTGLLHIMEQYTEGLKLVDWIKLFRAAYSSQTERHRFRKQDLICCIDFLMRMEAVEKNVFQIYVPSTRRKLNLCLD